MKRHTLQEVAKFAAGVVAADFFVLWWMSQQKQFFPVDFLGARLTSDIIVPALIFDVALVFILVHYGWHVGKLPRIKERNYLMAAGAIFALVASAHIIRLFLGAELIVFGWEAPLWLSWVGTIVTSYLAYASFHFAARNR